MRELRYLNERDVPDLIDYARRAFRGVPEYHRMSSLAFQIRGAEAEGNLASALAAPQWHYYRTLAEKAAVLHDRLNKGHPFADGNKRFALTALLVFLGRNNALLIASDDELLDFSLSVADGTLDQGEACRFTSLRVFDREWTEEEIARWAERVDERPGEGQRIAEALAAWRQRSHPTFIRLPGKDIESVLKLAAASGT